MNCPICNKPLQEVIELHGTGSYFYVVWCGNGECPSEISNLKHVGETAEQAFDALEKELAKEP